MVCECGAEVLGTSGYGKPLFFGGIGRGKRVGIFFVKGGKGGRGRVGEGTKGKKKKVERG